MNAPDHDDAHAYVEDLTRADDALLEAMADLFAQGQTPHHEKFPQMFGPAGSSDEDREAVKAYLKGFFKPRNPFRARSQFAKGWFTQGKLSGYLLYQLYESSNIFYGKPRWNCFVEDIVVSSAARGLGGASALMEALLEQTEPLGECALSGTVWHGNDASVRLFEKHGFKPLSQSFYKVSQ